MRGCGGKRRWGKDTGDGKKWMDSRYIVEVECRWLANRFNVKDGEK